MSDIQATFNVLVGELDYPMFIVTAATDAERAGCLVGFATQTSIDPSRFLVCLSHQNRTYRVPRCAEVLAVHFVAADAVALAELFGGRTGDQVEKACALRVAARAGWRAILDRCENWFVGCVVERLRAGDHDAFLLEPIAAAAGTAPGQFSFRRAKRIDPGHPV
jgi:flavin reductase (DIM6/NTAB) family NADH-FMN oxidoreductase RutF